MKTRRLFAVASCLLAAFALCCFSGSFVKDAMAQQKTIKIGLITSVTGLMAPSFRPLVEAAKPAADFLNQKGGITIKGEKYQIEVITADDQSAPPGAVSAANKLIQEGVRFVVAPLFIPSTMAIAPVCEQAKVLRLTSNCVEPSPFGPPAKLSFDGESTIYNIPYMHDKLLSLYPHVKRVAVIRPDDPGARLVTELTEKDMKKRGIEVVYSEAYKQPTEDFYPLLTKALAQKPDAIQGIFGIIPWAKGIIEQSREMGFTGPVWAITAFGDMDLLKSVLDPKYAYDICTANPDVSSPKMPAVVKEFAKVMEKATREKYDFGHVLTLQAVWQIVQGIQLAQSLDTEKVAAALETAKSIDTPYGPGRFVGQEFVGMNRLFLRSIPFTRIAKDGKLETEFLPVKY